MAYILVLGSDSPHPLAAATRPTGPAAAGLSAEKGRGMMGDDMVAVLRATVQSTIDACRRGNMLMEDIGQVREFSAIHPMCDRLGQELMGRAVALIRALEVHEEATAPPAGLVASTSYRSDQLPEGTVVTPTASPLDIPTALRRA